MNGDTLPAHPLLAALPSTTQREVLRHSRILRYGPRRVIARAAPRESVFILQRGVVSVSRRMSASHAATLFIARAPSAWGDTEALLQHDEPPSATTLNDVEVLCLPAALFSSLARAHASVRDALWRLSLRRNAAIDMAVRIASGDVAWRLANLLADYADALGDPTPAGLRLDTPLSIMTLARDLGASRRSVITAVQALRDGGVLVKRDSAYLVADLAALQRCSAPRTSLLEL